MTIEKNNKILVAMSGGVDSSVTALLSKEMGLTPTGVTMVLFDDNIKEATSMNVREASCFQNKNVIDAKAICDKLGIDFFPIELKDLFKEKVIDEFIDYYENGLTPNPCVRCNKYLKFGALLNEANKKNIYYFATGHYANVEEKDGLFYLKKAKDDTKDQSYMLYSLTQEVLSRVKFPLGNLTKKEVREIAEKNGFHNANKSDSEDICFVPDGDYAEVIKKYTNKNYPKGKFLLKDGTVLGEHKGIIYYTIGMRKGLGISYKHPLYVCEIDLKNNNIILSEEKDLYKDSFLVRDYNFILGKAPDKSFECMVKTRYHQKEVPCKVDVIDEKTLKISLFSPLRAITKGQAAVFYDKDYVLGGGTIL